MLRKIFSHVGDNVNVMDNIDFDSGNISIGNNSGIGKGCYFLYD